MNKRKSALSAFSAEDTKTFFEGLGLPLIEGENGSRLATKILNEFSLPEETSHIINGHVPVRQSRGEHFINIAEYPRFDEMKTQVNVDGKLYPLTEISNIIGALSKARFNIPDISVYVDESEKSKFKKFKLENYLDLPEIDREKFHGIHYDQIKLF